MAEGQNVSDPPFGPYTDADSTRQAQHQFANDMPVDVNMNAVVARSQALTFDLAGKSFTSNQDRRDKMADAGAGIYKPT